MRVKYFVAILVLVIYIGSSNAQDKPPIEAYPYTGYDNLPEKAAWLLEDMQKHNMQNGLVMPGVLQPPVGNADLTTANQEDGGNKSGPYLAALSYQYAVTKDKKIKALASKTFQAIDFLEKVTGTPGMMARSIKLSDKPQPHEEWFFSQLNGINPLVSRMLIAGRSKLSTKCTQILCAGKQNQWLSYWHKMRQRGK